MKKVFLLAMLGVFNFTIAQKTVELKEFKNIVVGSDAEITMIKSNSNKLVINSIDDEDSEIKVKGNSLVFDVEGNFTLYYTEDIESITIASDAMIKGEDVIKSNKFSISAASDAKVYLKLNVNKLKTVANSDAEIILEGNAKKHSIVLSTDAELEAKDLITQNSNLVLSSDAEAIITAKNVVNATLSSDAVLKIYGNPDEVKKLISGDAEIIIVK
ncbi:DUF2807 domain-containing protein [uncultured Flavobacterium sp.]|uniref:GIN domain-containing protein n=1 Tax=uncultured Flavobacterium sp. TaxID=165435 RepID=UPI0025CDA820|nr:DUF2807 domain-containing protein [uncultured Flavobacterium sp.]